MKNIMNERLTISESSPLKARFYDYKHFTYPWHFHPEYEIIYIKESCGIRFVGNSIERYVDGDILFLGPNLPHYMKSDDAYFSDDCTSRVRGTIIQFEKEFMHHSIDHYPHLAKIRKLFDDSLNGIYFPAGSSPKLEELLDKIPTETGIDQIISLLQLFKEMEKTDSRKVISSSEFTHETSIENTSRIHKIVAYLNKNYTRSISLEEISSFAAMNPSAFCRFFKSKTGKSLKNYLLDMRIDYACKLLLMNNINIMQISAECGFDTISHFNQRFRKNTGYTPSEYRKMMSSI